MDDSDRKNREKKPRQASVRNSGTSDRDVGNALRSAYQQTVHEPIPDEMLDLLGKLS